jgi:hypothetical protein
MAAQEIVVTPHTLPAGYCFTTLQDLLDTFSSHQTVLLPAGSTQIIVSDSTPGPADQDKVWLKVDGVGNPVNFYWFNGGSWQEVNPPLVFWGIGSNVGNAYTVSVANPPPALVTGQLYLFKVPAANTGASTLQINAFGAFAFNAAGVALTSGQLVVNSYIGAVWTGTTFELFGAGSPTIDVTRITPGSNKQRIETTAGVPGWRGGWTSVTQSTIPTTIAGASNIGNHLLGAVPNLMTAWLQVKTGQTDQGYSALDRVELCKALTVDGGSNDKQAYSIVVDLTSVYLIPSIYTGIIVPNKTTGAYTAGDITATIA